MKPDKRAFVAMPGYGHLSPSAARGFWRCSATPELIYSRYNEGSLLAANFNAMWCDALNMLVDGQQLDYFAMQHADIGPEDFWLDKLIDELEANDLDVLGVVIPIKDRHGLTSIALEKPDGDRWNPLCRLTMSEVYRLPETFTSEDVGYKLLLNTGLWVCRFDPKWVGDRHFTINDRIVRDRATNKFIYQTEPEDWNFSRQLHEAGLKIGCTRKINAVHRGDIEFTNMNPWGTMPHDAQWIEKSVIPDDGFKWPHDVPGWLRHSEGRALYRLAAGKRVLEVGSYCGLSTICLAQSADHVTSVDPHDGRGTQVHQDTFEQLVDNLHRYGVRAKVTPHVDTFQEFKFQNICTPYDLIFIDGAHDYQSVSDDILNACDLLAPGGLIAFHDYRSPIDPGVTKAVDEFIATGADLLSTHDSLAVVRPPAAVPLEV